MMENKTTYIRYKTEGRAIKCSSWSWLVSSSSWSSSSSSSRAAK
jgi:hypothetical protein